MAKTDTIDSTDQRLIALLRHDARLSVAALAAKLGVSRGTVNNRIAKLEAAGVIVGYTVQLRPDALTFADARAIAEYLQQLGISHLYLSPVLTAVRGSTHGYDITDPTSVSAGLGGPGVPDRLADMGAGHQSACRDAGGCVGCLRVGASVGRARAGRVGGVFLDEPLLGGRQRLVLGRVCWVLVCHP